MTCDDTIDEFLYTAYRGLFKSKEFWHCSYICIRMEYVDIRLSSSDLYQIRNRLLQHKTLSVPIIVFPGKPILTIFLIREHKQTMTPSTECDLQNKLNQTIQIPKMAVN
jgi:hypothetical protein